MANVTAQIKRSFVSWLAYRIRAGDLSSVTAGDGETVLRNAIEAYVFSSVDGIKGGQVVASTSANGISVAFATPMPALLSGWSITEIAALAQELLEIHDVARRDVVNCLRYGLDIATTNQSGWPDTLPAEAMTSAEAEAAATYDKVCTQMQYLMPTVTEVRGSYSYARSFQGAWV